MWKILESRIAEDKITHENEDRELPWGNPMREKTLANFLPYQQMNMIIRLQFHHEICSSLSWPSKSRPDCPICNTQ